jgi:hypothetical protein
MLLQACRVTVDAHMGIATHSPRDTARSSDNRYVAETLRQVKRDLAVAQYPTRARQR